MAEYPETFRVTRTANGWENKRRNPINPESDRMRKLKAKDRKARAECTSLPCVCGCNLPAQWAHLETRAYESTRHEPWNSVPACEYLHPWMDQGKGRRCRTAMKNKAKELGRRLEHADVYSLLVDHGYYAELDRKRAMER